MPLASELDMHCHLQFLTCPRDILQVGITQSLSTTPRCTGKTLIIPTSEAVWLPGKVARASASVQIKGKTPVRQDTELSSRKTSLTDHGGMGEHIPLWMISISMSKQKEVCSKPIGGIWVVTKSEFRSYSTGSEPGGREFLGRAGRFTQAPFSKHHNVVSFVRNYVSRMWIFRGVGGARGVQM